MTRVALLCSRISQRGGLEKNALSLARAFQREGCKVTILSSDFVEIDHVRVIAVSKRSKISSIHLKRFDHACQDWLRIHPHDIVFGLERTTSQTHYRAGNGVHAQFLKQRLLFDPLYKRLSHSFNPLQTRLLKMEKGAFESPGLRLLFTNSEMVRSEILSSYTIAPEKIKVVPNGVEWESFAQPFEDSLQNLPIRPNFLFIGNGYFRKGLHYLLKGMAELGNREIHLDVVGKEKNMRFFQQLVKKLSLLSQVTFHGPATNPLPFYKNASALIIPSCYDPFANVTVEALAMGLFVVSSAYNGGKEILNDQNGVVIENLFSVESVATALKKAIEFPKTKELAETIRKSVQHLDFSRQLDKIVACSLYDGL